MKNMMIAMGLVLAFAMAARAATTEWPPEKEKESVFTGRKLEVFKHGIRKEWGYATPQRDTFLVLHPKQARPNAPLYVVLHSAGHDVHSCLACTTTVGNHDIYRSPEDFFALYLDCRANQGDWWWGSEKYKGPEVSPTEKRVIDTVKWVIKHYGIDENRVYLCGNSMGGSGTLGIGMRHGDVFAAIKANVPAGVEHVSNRMYFPPRTRARGRHPPRPSDRDRLFRSERLVVQRPRRLRQGHERAEIRALPLLGSVRPCEQPREDHEGQRPDQFVRLAERQEERGLSGVHQRLDERSAALAGPTRRQEVGPGQRLLPMEERARRAGRGRDVAFPGQALGTQDDLRHPGRSDGGRQLAQAPDAAGGSGRNGALDVRHGRWRGPGRRRGVRYHPQAKDHRRARHAESREKEVSERFAARRGSGKGIEMLLVEAGFTQQAAARRQGSEPPAIP